MKRVLVLLSLWLLAGNPRLLQGIDFRVEWLSGRPIEALRFKAGSDVLRLCSIAQQKRCIFVKPGGAASCVHSGGVLSCNSTGVTQLLQDFTAASTAPFNLEASFRRSTNGEVRSSGQIRSAEIHIAPKGLRIVIPVDLETYVAGVLEGEAGGMKSPQAIQAMAVVARTWAMRSRGRHRHDGFDFCSLTHCQVFRLPSDSRGGPSTGISRAVEETNGKVLKYRGQLIDAYFSADCGGVTEAAGEVWPDRAQPYLVSSRDPYCAGSKNSSWQQTLSLATVSKLLRDDMGVSLASSLLDLKIETRDTSGRAHTLRLEGGSARLVDANEFRYTANRRLGWNTLKSNLYTVERHGDSLVFNGRGLGHGVGLCQAGAENMGQMQIASEKILATYFPGATVSDFGSVATGDPILSSEHFEFVFPDGQEPLVNESLHALETMRRQLESRIGVLPPKVRVETFQTTSEFIRATGQPGWAAASTDGVSISLQPLDKLKQKGILSSTLRHELAHLGVHRLRSPEVPRWFEEGLVLYLTEEQVARNSSFDFRGRTLEECVSKPRSEAEMKAAYAVALEKVRTAAHERGEEALWEMLKHPSGEDVRWLRDQ